MEARAASPSYSSTAAEVPVSNDGVAKLMRRVDSLTATSRASRRCGIATTPSTQLNFRNHTEARTWGGFDTLPVPAYWRVAASTSSLDIVVVSTTLHFDMNLE